MQLLLFSFHVLPQVLEQSKSKLTILSFQGKLRIVDNRHFTGRGYVGTPLKSHATPWGNEQFQSKKIRIKGSHLYAHVVVKTSNSVILRRCYEGAPQKNVLNFVHKVHTLCPVIRCRPNFDFQ